MLRLPRPARLGAWRSPRPSRKQESLDLFAQAQKTYADILGDSSPTVIEVCDLSMGTDLRYSARVALGDRDAADKLCDKLQAAGGACIVLKN